MIIGSQISACSNEEDYFTDNWRHLIVGVLLGTFFIKHHKWGKPKLRLIWASNDFEEIFWGNPRNQTKKDIKAKGKIKTSEIKSIQEGLIKSKSNKNYSELLNSERIKCSFTLVTKTRTLELEAPTSDSKLKWMHTFEVMLHEILRNKERTINDFL